jgi:Tfp pilus assembly protein PilF
MEGPGPLAFSKDGRMLAIAHSGQNVRLIDPDSAKEIATLSAPDPQIIMDLCFNEDGSLLAAATGHQQIQLWDLREIRRQLATMGLDWDLPPYPPSSTDERGTKPLRITVRTPDPKEELRPELKRLNLAIEQNPENTELYRQRGRLLRLMGEYSKSIDDLNEAIAKQPQAADYLARAWDHQNLNEYPRAEADLLKALEMDSNNMAACNELAWVYVTGPAEIRSPERALPLAQKTVRKVPTNAAYRNTRGVVYYRLGQFDAAVEDLHRAIQDNKDGATADDLFFLAMSYHRLGDAVKARDCYDEAMHWWQDQGELTPRQIAELTSFRAEAAGLLGIRSSP